MNSYFLDFMSLIFRNEYIVLYNHLLRYGQQMILKKFYHDAKFLGAINVQEVSLNVS